MVCCASVSVVKVVEVEDSPHYLLRCPSFSAVMAQSGGPFDGVVDTVSIGHDEVGSCCCFYVPVKGGGIADMKAIGDQCISSCSEDEGLYYHKSLLILCTV